MANPRRAVITGHGALTPLGNDAATIWEALTTGRCGIAPITAFDPSRLPSRIAGEVRDFNARKALDNKNEYEKAMGKSLKLMARTIQLGLIAAKFAMKSAGLERGRYEPTRFGIVFAANMIAVEVDDLVDASRAAVTGDDGRVDLLGWGAQGIDTIEPTWMLKFLPNMPACHISVLYDLQGPSNSITQDDVASLNALGEAYRHIERGQADAFLVGGTDSKLSLLSMARHVLFLPLSKHNDDPASACRPFDADHDGMVVGEGATVLVTEELEHARRRGATILAEIAGFASAFDLKRDGEGVARAVQRALHEAGIGPEDLDHINAHGTAVPEQDILEARGLRLALGDAVDRVPVFAAKGYMGNLGPAAGVTELMLSLLALHHGQLPPTLNHQRPDPACPLAVHASGMRPVSKPYVLKVGFTDLGQCAAVVLKKYHE